jgi:calcium binding protein 39
MGFFDFLKSKSKSKPHEIMRGLSRDLTLAKAPSLESFATLSISDSELNELENYLAAACAGVSANVHIKKQPKPEEVEKCLFVAKEDAVLTNIANHISELTPETRRIMSAIWGYLLKLEHPRSFQRPIVDYLVSHFDCIDALMKVYGQNARGADVTIGIMIRDASRFAKSIDYILNEELVFKLFSVMASSNFDVSSDAFQTMREVITNHKDVSAPWLAKNFTRFFTDYMKPLRTSEVTNYVVVRQSLSILSAILLDRQFMDSMLQFVNNEEYLKAILMLMSNDSKVVKYEAFHVFKIFAANPNKPLKVSRILRQNSERILKILDQIENDRLDDNEFRQDKKAVVNKLEALVKAESKSSNH